MSAGEPENFRFGRTEVRYGRLQRIAIRFGEEGMPEPSFLFFAEAHNSVLA
jgi:hypothetical protein